MTTFILHGGNTSIPTKRNNEFYVELAKRTPNNGKILFIFFAKEQDKWEQFLDYNKTSFKKTRIKKDFEFDIATPEKSQLINQIDSADCIYICGGNDEELKKPLAKIKNLRNLLEGKTIMGCSAGANILSTYFYRNSKERIEKGLGILPIKVFCHYNPNKKEKLEQLKVHGEKLPIYTIPEIDFIILE
jgi:peptidase E